jgi:hypothetical protein
MKMPLRRFGADRAAERQGNAEDGSTAPLGAGSLLGSFIESGLRVEVMLAGEHRLWLQCRPARRGPECAPVDVGPVAWDDNRTPCLSPVPEWLSANSWTTSILVLKSAALFRAVVKGEALDPTLGIEVNTELGHLVHRSEPVQKPADPSWGRRAVGRGDPPALATWQIQPNATPRNRSTP